MSHPGLVLQPRPFLDARRLADVEIGDEVDSRPGLSGWAFLGLALFSFALVAAGMALVGWPAGGAESAPTIVEPAATVSPRSPVVAVGPIADNGVGHASPTIDHVTAVAEYPDSWLAVVTPTPGTTIVSSTVSPSPASSVGSPPPVIERAATASEVGLIPAAIAWRDDDGVAHQGLIGVDDIPSEVLALPEGVTLED